MGAGDNNHRGLAIACLGFRLLTTVMLAISIYLIVINTASFSFDANFKVGFKNIIGYRYVLATSCIGLLYTLLLMPITIFMVFTKTKGESFHHLIDLCMFGDKVISFLLATGIGAGLLVSIDLRRFLHELEEDGLMVSEIQTALDKYFERGIIATAFLLVGAIFMAIDSIISYVMRMAVKNTSFFG